MAFRNKSSNAADQVDNLWFLEGLASRLKEWKNSELDEFIVIGIDFGTTYSGAAWASVADFESDQINLITSWPGTGREEGKAPTELLYEDERLMWGYAIPPDADPIRWFKPLLLREEDLTAELRGSEFLLRARKALRESQKTATDLIADYLGALWRHILDTIYKARGKSVIEAMTFHVVITVPAIWKDYARQGMEEAARKSGILDPRLAGPTTLTFAPEPEAAALATLCENGRSINVGDVFVICDAGGGTVDLISYEVGDTDPIELHETVIGTGGLCGGIFIDEAFESMCKSRLGRRWNKLSQNGIKEIMKDEWEYAIKPQFKLDDSMMDKYIVAVPAEAFEGSDLNDYNRKPIIKAGRIYFDSSDIQKAFTSAFSGIESLVDGQISKIEEKQLSVTVRTAYLMETGNKAHGAKGIILVGGLGSSPYLHEYLKKRYSGKKIDVLQSTGIRPRTSICRGAIYKGFLDGPGDESGDKQTLKLASRVSVVSTIARQSLGVKYSPPFIEGIHAEIDRYWNDNEGHWSADNQMMWYLRKGDNVSKMEPKQEDFYRLFSKAEEFYASRTKTIYQCEHHDPPSRLTTSVKELCTIKYKLDIPFSSLEDFTGANGKILKKHSYKIQMIPSGASNEFSMLYQGEKLWSQNVRIDFQ
ncbi:hypothetical protein MMC31_004963 [Peltigera leucophlebia]|nr:hypothetical protein [Peltigera leucophlebia]